MKWVLVTESIASIKKYHLTESDAIKLELKYNLEQQSVRIHSDDSHRLFFIDKTGLWHNKTILKNEYGVEIGRLVFDRAHGNGTIEFEGRKYQYSIRNNAELVVYEHTVSAPMAVCDLSAAPSYTSMQANKYSSDEFACFLLGLCWYQYPLTHSEQLEFSGHSSW